MAITPAPQVPSFPEPVPNYRTQDDSDFNESMQNLVDTLNPFHAGMLAMATWMRTTGNEVTNIAAGADSSAQDAAGFAAQARAIAAYKGPFSAQSGTLAIPASVSTTSAGVTTIWMLLQTTANIQTHVPGVSGVWYNLTVESGVQLVSSPTDVRPERAVNPTWGFLRSVLSTPWLNLSVEDPSQSVDGAGVGSFGLFQSGINPGLYPSGQTNGGRWHVETKAFHGNCAIQYAYPFAFDQVEYVNPVIYFRIRGFRVASFSGIGWQPLSGGGSGGSSVDGPIKTQVQNFSASNQDGSGNIAITINCAAHSSFVINAQNSPFPSAVGAYNITLTNLPAASEGLFIGRIRARNLGRKPVNFILPAGLTASWLALPTFSTANTAGATTWDWIEFFRSPDSPNVIYFDQVNGR